MSDQISFILRHIPNLLWGFPSQRPGGLLLTILLSAGSILVGLVLAIGVAVALHSRFAVIRFLFGRLVWVLRSIPLIVMLILFFQFLGTGAIFGLELSSFWSAALTLTLYSMAYQADVLKGGITAVPQHLIDDSRVLGASRWTVLTTVTIPYAVRTMRPALVTQAITVFKDSSVVVVLGVADLTTTARIVLGADISNAPFWVATYLTVGFLYWCVAFALSRFIEAKTAYGSYRLAAAHV